MTKDVLLVMAGVGPRRDDVTKSTLKCVFVGERKTGGVDRSGEGGMIRDRWRGGLGQVERDRGDLDRGREVVESRSSCGGKVPQSTLSEARNEALMVTF